MMKKKKAVTGRKLKKPASQPQGKWIPSYSSSAKLDVKFVSQSMKAPSNLPLPLLALFKAMVAMPSGHNIFVPMENATFGFRIEYIHVSKDDVF